MIRKLIWYGIGLVCIELAYRTAHNNFNSLELIDDEARIRQHMLQLAREGDSYFSVMSKIKQSYGKQPHRGMMSDAFSRN